MEQLTTPVVLIIFKRPNETKKVFDRIKQVKPRKLFIISDGPKNKDEAAFVLESRQIIEDIDWPCEVLTDFAQNNLGCRIRISSGLDWVFSQAKEAIILEDDCLPDISFFHFCQELLEKYRHNTQIMQISGNNFQKSNNHIPNSYYFSRIPNIWGWATWHRAWQQCDINMADWPKMKQQKMLLKTWGNTAVADYWQHLFDNIYHNKSGKSDTWDAQWVYTCFKQNGLSINPTVNLISNIGFGAGATRSQNILDPKSNLPTTEIKFPLRHPSIIKYNHRADKFTLKFVYRINNTLVKKNKMGR